MSQHCGGVFPNDIYVKQSALLTGIEQNKGGEERISPSAAISVCLVSIDSRPSAAPNSRYYLSAFCLVYHNNTAQHIAHNFLWAIHPSHSLAHPCAVGCCRGWLAAALQRPCVVMGSPETTKISQATEKKRKNFPTPPIVRSPFPLPHFGASTRAPTADNQCATNWRRSRPHPQLLLPPGSIKGRIRSWPSPTKPKSIHSKPTSKQRRENIAAATHRNFRL
jgi:hypothetical protein